MASPSFDTWERSLGCLLGRDLSVVICMSLGPSYREGALVLTCLMCWPALHGLLVPHPLGMRALRWKARVASSEPALTPHDLQEPSALVRRASHPAPPWPVLCSLCLCKHTPLPQAGGPHPFLWGQSKSWSNLQGSAPVLLPLESLQQSLLH